MVTKESLRQPAVPPGGSYEKVFTLSMTFPFGQQDGQEGPVPLLVAGRHD